MPIVYPVQVEELFEQTYRYKSVAVTFSTIGVKYALAAQGMAEYTQD